MKWPETRGCGSSLEAVRGEKVRIVSIDQTTFDFANNNLASLITCFIKSPVIVIPKSTVGREMEYTG